MKLTQKIRRANEVNAVWKSKGKRILCGFSTSGEDSSVQAKAIEVEVGSEVEGCGQDWALRTSNSRFLSARFACSGQGLSQKNARNGRAVFESSIYLAARSAPPRRWISHSTTLRSKGSLARLIFGLVVLPRMSKPGRKVSPAC